MTKAQNIEYILKSQEDLDDSVREEYPDIPYTKDELNAMSAKEVKEALQNIIDAEEITYNLYQAEYIRHGRSE